MPLRADNQDFVNENYKGIDLRAMLGGYEFVFMAMGKVSPLKDKPLWISISSGRFAVRTAAGQKELGVGFPSKPILIQQNEHEGNFNIELKMPVSPYQISKLEEFRNGEELHFTVTLSGIGGRGDRKHEEHQALTVDVAQSAWIQQLKQSGAKEIFLIEVAMSAVNAAADRRAVVTNLREAKTLFDQGLYNQCVAECRKAIEELRDMGEKFPWASLASLATREEMKKSERLVAVGATAHLFSQLATHSEGRGGTQYSRADAKFLMILISAYLDHVTSD